MQRSLMAALAASALALAARGGEIALLQPTGAEDVPLLSKRKAEYLALPLAERRVKFADDGERGILAVEPNEPEPVLVSWRWTPGEGETPPVFAVELRMEAEGGVSVPAGFVRVREPYAFFRNLEIGRRYEVSVTALAGGRGLASATRKFRTADAAPRILSVPGVPNFRDIGGRTGLGGRRIRQGLVYRSAGLNDNPEDIDFLTWEECRAEFDAGTLTNRGPWQAKHMAKIYRGEHDANDWHRVPTATARGRERLTDESRRILLCDLGIRTDLDLRSEGETAGMSVSPIGDRVNWIRIGMTAYRGLAKPRGKELTGECLRVFLDEANYPIVFHCIGGQDRTGTLAYVLEALLGVDENALAADWECSGFTNAGAWFRHEGYYDEITAVMDAMPGGNVTEKAEAYAKACGLTDGDIAKLRSMLLE